MRRWPLLLLFGCDAVDTGLTGKWDLTLTCTTGALDICSADTLALLRMDDEEHGEHRSFFPGPPRPDGSWTGMPGPVFAEHGAEVVLLFRGDNDDPFVSEDERAAWSDHVLQLTGVPESVCWTADWSWLRSDGTEDASGTVQLLRHGALCR